MGLEIGKLEEVLSSPGAWHTSAFRKTEAVLMQHGVLVSGGGLESRGGLDGWLASGFLWMHSVFIIGSTQGGEKCDFEWAPWKRRPLQCL